MLQKNSWHLKKKGQPYSSGYALGFIIYHIKHERVYVFYKAAFTSVSYPALNFSYSVR